MNNIVKGNVCTAISKVFSGFNMNALKYLLPLWISPITGVTIRLVFGAVAIWIISIFFKPEDSTLRQKIYLMILGGLGIYGYMFLFLSGLNYTTPVSNSIFFSLEPIWVFLISALFLKEKVTLMKVTGILLGLVGALLCILFQASGDKASNAMLGNMLCFFSSIVYSIYLIISRKLILEVGNMTLIKYTFLGAATVSLIVNSIYGFYAPVLHEPIFSTPFLVLLFILIFPTTLSYLLLPVGIKYLSPTVIAIYGYVILIVVAITSFVLGQDHFTWSQFGAIILICLSVYMVEIAENKRTT